MRTIYLLRKMNSYGGAPKILRAFETRQDAEDLIELMAKADVEGLEVAELELEPTRSYSHDRVPQPPRFLGSNDPTPKAALP